jgi:drug/metabolite transporter (DMT)-like permease
MGREEASHIAPFIGAMVSIFTFLLSSAILGETLSAAQKGGVALLVLAGLLLSYQDKGEGGMKLHKGFLWAALSGLIFGLSHVLAKYIYIGYPFFVGLVWTKGTVGIVAILLLLAPNVREILRRKKTDTKEEVTNARSPKTLAIVGTDKILGFVGTLLVQYAIAIGSVTVVNAMAGIQFAFVFAGILVLTKFFPRVLSEYFTRRELALQTVAIALVVIGSALFFI